MQVERVTLRDGQWAMAHTRPSHAQMKAFYKSFRGKAEDELMETQADIILLLCTEWQVKGENGANLPLNKEGIDNAPQDIVTELTDILSDYIGDKQTVADKVKAIASNMAEDDPLKGRLEAFAVELGNA